MKTLFRSTMVLAGLVLAASCTDLAVTNPNQPDQERALSDAGDVQALISGSFNRWWITRSSLAGMGPALSVISFEHSAWPANFGMVEFSRVPRQPVNNSVSFDFFDNLNHAWLNNYRVLSAARNGLLAIEAGVDLGPDEARARAFAKFTQGLALGNLALIYDQAFILDETTADLADLRDPVPYDQVMQAALAALDEAAAIAGQSNFTIPESWMSVSIGSSELVQVIHAWKARFRTQVARNPAERAALDWQAVIDDVDQAITTDFRMNIGGAFSHFMLLFTSRPLWAQVSNFVLGMADQSGGYQDWISTPIGNREPFLIVTPDERFPQGETLAAQRANPGVYITIPGEAGDPSITLGGQWGRPDRGTWRWSNYRDYRHDAWMLAGAVGPAVELSVRELRLLKAEGLLRMGDQAGAAAIIDETRTTNGGLGPALQNTDCVPRLPSGECGDLMETLKWEHRMETYHMGWGKGYFESRGWGDLMEGTFLHLPIPARDLLLLDMANYTFGGVGQPGGAPVGTYGF